MKSEEDFKGITEQDLFITKAEYALQKRFQEQLEQFIEATFKPKERGLPLWMSPAALELWDKMMKDEFEKHTKKYPETRKLTILDSGEDSSEESKSSIQED